MGDYTVTLEDLPAGDDVSAVVRGLVRFNDRHAEPEDWRALACFLRGPDGTVAGGAVGYTHWRWLFVSHLWVDESLRGRGYGAELLRRAESEARARGCLRAHLDTFSFQARGFYESLGYVVFGALEEYPPGHTRYFLRKDPLGQEPAAPTLSAPRANRGADP